MDDRTQVGIWIRAGAVAQVRLNSVRKHLCSASFCGPDLLNAFQAFGIIVDSGPRGSQISENRLAGNDAGILQFASPDCCTISENYLTKNRYGGILIQDGNGTTSENEISGGQIGIAVLADFIGTVGVLRGDEISGTTVAPVREFSCCGFTAKAIVKKD